MTPGERAIIAAIEHMRGAIVALPLAIAYNAANTVDPNPPPPPSDKPDKAAPNGLVKALGALAGALGRLLGPLAAFGTFLNAGTSGFSVFSKAIQLFATAVAPVLLPVFFSLAVGLATASEVVFKKLLPALDGFYKLVLSSAIPAMVAVAETAGRAASALAWLSKTSVGRAVLGGDGGAGGMFGAFNRTLDRAGSLFGKSADPDAGKGTADRIERTVDDLTRVMLPVAGDMMVGAKNWTKRQFGFGGDDDASGGSGDAMTVAGGGGTAAGRARADTMRELILSMGPKASSGSAASTWSRAQMSALNQSPFERRMLEMMQQVVNTMARVEGEPGGGRMTPFRAIGDAWDMLSGGR